MFTLSTTFICLYREAMRLQCFTPTRTYKRDDHYPICTKLHYGCLLALCGPTMHVATLCGVFRTFFFFCLVCQPRLLGKKKKKKKKKFTQAYGPLQWEHFIRACRVQWINTFIFVELWLTPSIRRYQWKCVTAMTTYHMHMCTLWCSVRTSPLVLKSKFNSQMGSVDKFFPFFFWELDTH